MKDIDFKLGTHIQGIDTSSRLKKSVKWSICFIMALVLSTVLSSPTIASENVMTIGYAEYRPYSFVDTGQEVKGIEVDVLNYALNQQLGIKLSHQVLPWKRVQMQVENGLLDAYVAVLTDKRSRYAVHSTEAIAFGQVSLFISKQHAQESLQHIDSLHQVADYRVGTLNGSGWVKKNLPDQDVTFAHSMKSLTQMLIKQRIDIIPDNRYIMNYYLKTVDLNNEIQEIPLKIKPIKLVLLINKSSSFAKIIPQLDTVLKKMREEGVFDRIFDCYR